MPECAAEPPLPCTAAKPRSSLEARALCDLQSYHVLDTEPDQEFDDITVAATAVCGAPIGIVSCVPPPFLAPTGLSVLLIFRQDSPLVLQESAGRDEDAESFCPLRRLVDYANNRGFFKSTVG